MWLTIIEKVPTLLQKDVGALAKNWQLFLYGNEMVFGQGYP